MVGLCEGGNEPPGSLKAICKLIALMYHFSCGCIAFLVVWKRRPDGLKSTREIILRGLSKKYPTLNFPAQSSDSKAAPLRTVEGGTVMRMLEFFHRIRLCQSLAGGRQGWFNRFKDGRTLAESEQRCGRPQTARCAAVVERVRNLVMADRRLTVREIAEEVGVSKDSAHAILRDDLNMNRVAAKFVPKLLSPEQKTSVMTLHRTFWTPPTLILGF
ncbi:hypothetical protein ANN_07079 [Periplaneta americana]|uniref:Uncharacterized protein n=1 Tax=Periplaneta americana TaxID=6978 RepID=A0ABQ8THC5_PERAM|nr:hypothetical protein ANN_07079 [Periplaneta americana]